MIDLIIIGGSAAATSAGVYAARRGLSPARPGDSGRSGGFKIITKDFGGEVATSGEIGNWPGISQTDGITLSNQFKEHLKFYGVVPEEGVEVEKIIKQENGYFLIETKGGQDYQAKAIIVATGVHPKELNVQGEKEFRNKGVSYCTTCDGPLFSGKTTTVIGGGNSALEAGLMLTDISSRVYIINKNAEFKGDKVLLDKLMTKNNVEIIYNAKTTQIVGEQPAPTGASGFVTGLKYEKEDKGYEIKTDGVFVHIGMIPNSNIVPADVQKNTVGEIVVNKNCETNIPGFYAAGDVTDVPFNQIVIAAGQGCIATLSAVQYLNKLK